MRRSAIGYCVLGALICFFDQITKHLVLIACTERFRVAPFIFCDLVFNRGISWGIFNSESSVLFGAITIVIAAITGGLLFYAVRRLWRGQVIFAETLIIAGSCANLADRFQHFGVVDFIQLSWHSWSTPLFNIADVCIVGGVVLLAFRFLYE